MDNKPDIRRHFRRWRAEVDEGTRGQFTRRACSRLAELPEWTQAEMVALYMALPGEPHLGSLWERAWSEGKRVALPIVETKDAPLIWRLYEPNATLQKGAFRVPEPPASAPTIEPSEIDLVVVPGLAADESGYRVGYGGGYYDRSLPGCLHATRVWLGMDDQVLPQVPHDDFDERVHVLVTQSRTVRASSEG